MRAAVDSITTAPSEESASTQDEDDASNQDNDDDGDNDDTIGDDDNDADAVADDENAPTIADANNTEAEEYVEDNFGASDSDISSSAVVGTVADETLLLQHHVVDVTEDPPYHSWHTPKILLVCDFSVVFLVMISTDCSCDCLFFGGQVLLAVFVLITHTAVAAGQGHLLGDPATVNTVVGWAVIAFFMDLGYLAAVGS